MRHPARLARLALPARDEAISPAVPSIGDTIAAVPKLRSDAVINDVPEHVGAFAVFNEPERIAPELKVVAALVNAVGPMAFNVDSRFTSASRSWSEAWPGSKPMLAIRTIGTLPQLSARFEPSIGPPDF